MNSSHRSSLKKLLVSASAVSIVVASFAAVPASFAIDTSVVPVADSLAQCRTISASATSYSGLPGEYQMAYSNKTGDIYTTFANGRPPVLTAGIGAWTPGFFSPSLHRVWQLPTVDYTPRGQSTPTGQQIAAPYGIDVDDSNGTLWVTQTRINAVSVYDIETNRQVWTSYNEANPAESAVNHPREVKVDAVSGHAFISGSGGVTVFDLKTHQVVHKIEFTHDGQADTGMNMQLDSEGGRLYVPALSAGTLNVINTRTLAVEKTISLHKDVADAALRPSDVTIDRSLQEIYVSSQGEMDRQSGVSKGNSGVTVYDLITGKYKKTIPFGKQTLAITADESQNLVYATDFATGKIGVIDSRTGAVVSEINVGSRGANDVLVTPSGEAYAVVKDTYAESLSTTYTIDPATGDYRESAVEPKGKNGADSAINANSLVKITPHIEKAEPNKSTETAPVELSSDSGTGATASVPKIVYEKGKVMITGKGFKDTKGGPSTVAVKLDSGSTFIGEYAYIFVDADKDGNFSTTIDVPPTWTAGSEHRVNLLTGSGNTNDPKRSLAMTVYVEGAQSPYSACAPQPTAQVDSSKSFINTFYPKGTPVVVEKKEEPQQQADPKVSASVTELNVADEKNELTLTGTGFYGDAVAEGVRVGVYEVDSEGNPVGEQIGAEQVVAAADVKDGSFTATLSVPGSSLNASKKYAAVAASVATQHALRASVQLTVKAPDHKIAPEKPVPSAPMFKDVSENSAFYREIQWLGGQGITTGWSDGTYRPGDNIERAAMAAYFYRLAGSPEVILPETSPFKDVDSSFPFYKEIVWMHQQGITTGYWDGTFRPHDPVNRDAMAAFFYRYAQAPAYMAPVNSPFSDVKNSDAFYKEIAWLKQQGITTGWPDGTYHPGEAIHRDAMAAFVYRYAKMKK